MGLCVLEFMITFYNRYSVCATRAEFFISQFLHFKLFFHFLKKNIVSGLSQSVEDRYAKSSQQLHHQKIRICSKKRSERMPEKGRVEQGHLTNCLGTLPGSQSISQLVSRSKRTDNTKSGTQGYKEDRHSTELKFEQDSVNKTAKPVVVVF